MSDTIETEIAGDLALSTLAKKDKALAEQIAQTRLDHRTRQAEQAAQHQRDEAAKAQAAADRAEADLRAALRRNWIGQGGRMADFEANYDAIRAAHMSELATRAAGAMPAAPRKAVQL